MKAKKIIALAMSAAMVVGTASMLTACGGDDEEKKGGTGSTYVWYAAGTDKKGTLGTDMGGSGEGGWNPFNIREEATFKQSETNPLQYTLTLDIYAGDADSGWSFKFLYKTSADEDVSGLTSDEMWTRQVGIKNIEGCEGEPPASVVTVDGVEYFNTGDSINKGNIALIAGNEGTYTFTLTMANATDTNPTITFKKDKPIIVSHEMYVYGDVNNFGFGNGEKQYPMSENINGTTTTWSYMLEVENDDLKRDAEGKAVEEGQTGQYAAVHLYNMKDKKTYHLADSTDYPEVTLTKDDINMPLLYAADSKFNLLPAGKYMITYNQQTNAVTIAEFAYEMYFRGSAMSWGTEIGDADAAFKLNESGDHTHWYGFLAVPAGATHEVKLYNAFDGTWYGDSEGANWKLTEGIYVFNFDCATEEITYDKYDDKVEIVITGTLKNGENYLHFGLADWSPRFSATEVSTIVTATLTVYDATVESGNDWLVNDGGIFAWKPVFTKADGENMVIDWDTNGVGNIMEQTAGTYTVTYNLNTHEVKYTPVQG